MNRNRKTLRQQQQQITIDTNGKKRRRSDSKSRKSKWQWMAFLSGYFVVPMAILLWNSSSINTEMYSIDNSSYDNENNASLDEQHSVDVDPLMGHDLLHPTSITSPSSDQASGTILVELTGEMGNNLQRLAYGRGIQFRLQRKYNITTQLRVRIKESHPWQRAAENLERCFPNLRAFQFFDEFNLVAAQDYESYLEHQRQTLGKERTYRWDKNINSATALSSELDQVIEEFADWAQHNHEIRDKFQYPFLSVRQFVPKTFLRRHYDGYRQFFQFNTQSCCAQRPDPDELVFHFRNFQTEIPKASKFRGLEELSPYKTATELFGRYDNTEPKKLAMTTRINNDAAQAYVNALQSHGNWTVRVISNQTDLQDFCFLMQSSKELIGIARSTFVLWAALLGDTPSARFYFVDSFDPPTSQFVHRELVQSIKHLSSFPSKQFHFEMFNSEAMDEQTVT